MSPFANAGIRLTPRIHPCDSALGVRRTEEQGYTACSGAGLIINRNFGTIAEGVSGDGPVWALHALCTMK
jgi:hypothetical protein